MKFLHAIFAQAIPPNGVIARLKRARTDEVADAPTLRILKDQRNRSRFIEMEPNRHGRVGGRPGGVGEDGREKEEREECFHDQAEKIGRKGTSAAIPAAQCGRGR
jgi:hypothetical protein